MSSLSDMQSKIKIARRRFQERPESRDFAPLADLLRDAGQYREALLLLDKGLRKFPNYVTGNVIKGRALIEAGYARLGRDALNRVLELDPQNLLALDLLIAEATERKAWKEVLGPLEKLEALEPEDEKLSIFLSKVRGKLQEDKQEPTIHQDYRTVVAETVPEVETAPEIEKPPVRHPAPVEEKIQMPDIVAGPLPAVEEESEVKDPLAGVAKKVVAGPEPGPSHVTMTMVDIYLAQGYREMAITALEEMLENNPGRQDVLDKLNTLREDPNCGVPESRKETKVSSKRSPAHSALAEQRLKDKDQFTSWIEGVNDRDDGVVGGDRS